MTKQHLITMLKLALHAAENNNYTAGIIVMTNEKGDLTHAHAAEQHHAHSLAIGVHEEVKALGLEKHRVISSFTATDAGCIKD